MASTDQVFRSFKAIVPGTDVTPGNGFVIACSTDGVARVLGADGGYFDAPFKAGAGFAEFRGYAIRGVDAAASTGTFTVFNCY